MPDFEPFELVNPGGRADLLIIADHASNALPPEYDSLGLPNSDFQRHIAYDVGTAGLARGLSRLLDASAVLSGFSRLLIDPNRGDDDPTLVMKLSDGSIIPGNRHADAAEVENRIARYYRPYHSAIEARVARAEHETGAGPAMISLHSFTPCLRGRPARPWHVGVLWGKDEANAQRMVEILRRDGTLCVGENEPYRGGAVGESLDQHAFSRDLPNVLIEVRNDLIETPEAQSVWAERLAPVLREVFAIA